MTNNVDKRSVSTDALETLGMIHFRKEYRDAIHLAVEPVAAGENLKRADYITLKDGLAYKCKENEALGIVDPFVKKVKAGESLWLVVLPRKITSLRHVWSHPDFKEEGGVCAEPKEKGAKQKAYEWIQNYAESFGTYEECHDYYDDEVEVSYSISAEDLISYGRSAYEDRKRGTWPEYLVRGGLLEGKCVSDEFWVQLGIYLGEELDPEYTGNFFSCSC